MQETHFKENNAEGMAILAKFKTHNSTYNGDGYRQKGEKGGSIFFSDKFWTEDECLYWAGQKPIWERAKAPQKIYQSRKHMKKQGRNTKKYIS